MKPILRNVWMTVVSLAVCAAWFSIANAAEVKTFPLNTTEGTEAVLVTAETITYMEREGLQVKVVTDHKSLADGGGCDNCTYLLVDKQLFKNGVIEIDLAGKPSAGAPAWARGFVGVFFSCECRQVQIRGLLSAPDECPGRRAAAEFYDPVFFCSGLSLA